MSKQKSETVEAPKVETTQHTSPVSQGPVSEDSAKPSRPQTKKGRDKLPLEEEIISILPKKGEVGLTNAQIRAKLGMRPGKQKTHLHQLMQKLFKAGKVAFVTASGANYYTRP